MALTDITIDFDLAQILGADFDPRRTKAYVTTNVESGTLMDTTTGETRLGDEAVTIASDGTGSFTTWATGADGNPISWQTSLVVDYPRTGHRDRKRRVFGPWTLTTADAGKNITELEDEQAVPSEYQTAFTASMEAIRTDAEAARDAAVDISGISTSDAVVEALVKNTGGAGPLTSAALADTFAPNDWVPDTTYRAGTMRFHNGQLYRARTTHTSSAFDLINWQPITPGAIIDSVEMSASATFDKYVTYANRGQALDTGLAVTVVGSGFPVEIEFDGVIEIGLGSGAVAGTDALVNFIIRDVNASDTTAVSLTRWQGFLQTAPRVMPFRATAQVTLPLYEAGDGGNSTKTYGLFVYSDSAKARATVTIYGNANGLNSRMVARQG